LRDWDIYFMEPKIRALRTAKLTAIFAVLFCIQNCAGAVKVTEADAKRSATEKPAPAISPLARQMKLSGRIELEVTIGAAGSVDTVKPLAGNPLLVECGVTAVRKWKFTPFLDHGSATAAVTTLTFEFRQ
jgi:outer membrane biosynthesis protein TonB